MPATLISPCVSCLENETDWSDYCCHDCRDRRRELRDRILNAQLQDRLDTGSAGDLIVVHRGWSRYISVDDMLANRIRCDTVTLTADGRHYIASPHEGPTADQVYVERWEPAGRAFHGFIDSVSRRIVQWG